MANYSLLNFRNLPVNTVEEISSLQFDATDELTQVEDVRVRRTNVDKAIALSRSEKYKTAVVVKAGDKYYKTETPVIGIDKEIVYTANGLKLPLRAIMSIDFHLN